MRRPLAAAVLAALALSGCRAMFQPPPQGRPTGREGWLQYAVGDLRVEAPASWRPSGDAERLDLEAPDGTGRLQIRRAEQRWAGEAQCLAAAEDALAQGAGRLSRPRQHPTTVAGRRAIVLEADQGEQGHGWAWGVCDGGTMYRLFLSGGTPLSREVLEAYRTLLATARIGGEA
jgi:hypothetical protein